MPPLSHVQHLQSIRSGETTGSAIKIASRYDGYVAEASGKHIHEDTAILLIPDVIGIWKNSQLIADQFAANGYYTLLLDEFDGDALPLNRPPGFDFMAWRSNNPPEKIDPIVEAGVKFLKEKGIKKIGAVGYCFGAKYVCRFLNGRGVDVGYCAHPVGQPDSLTYNFINGLTYESPVIRH